MIASRPAIGTPAEHLAFNSPDHGGDKLAAALAEVVTEALEERASR